jgi:hypothetical protein
MCCVRSSANTGPPLYKAGVRGSGLKLDGNPFSLNGVLGRIPLCPVSHTS